MEQASGSASIDSVKKPDTGTVYDLAIIGGGPGAMTAVVYAARKFLKVAMLTYDLQGQMGYTSNIENYMGFQTISGSELVGRFADQVKQFDVPILEGEKAIEIRKDDGIFSTEMDSGKVFRSKTVIVSTGKRDRKLNIPGEEEFAGRGVAYCSTCDGPFYRDLNVAVAGGGNSAFTAALDLLKVAKQVTLVNYSDTWQADAILQQSVKKADNVRFLESHEFVRIEGKDLVERAVVKDRKTGEEKILEVDGVFVEIGLIPNSELVKNLAHLNEADELVIDCSTETSVVGLYGAGDVTTVPHKQIIISAGEGAKAALSAYDYLTKSGLV